MVHEFHLSLLAIIGIASLSVISSKNPVDSVLYLVLVFLTSAAYLLLLEAEFIALIFVVIYVGAIAVLFLFIVMMLDIKIHREKNLLFQYLPVGLLMGCIFFLEIFFALEQNFLSLPLNPSLFQWHNQFDEISNLELVGQVLYTDFLPCFLVAGVLLLIAMIGAIVLTLNFSSLRGNEIVGRQLSRRDFTYVPFKSNKN